MKKLIVFLAVLLALTASATALIPAEKRPLRIGPFIESKDSYQFAEMQFFTLRAFARSSYVLVPEEGPAFRLFKVDGEEEVEVHPVGPLEHGIMCVDGVLHEFNEPIPRSCERVPRLGLQHEFYPIAWHFTDAFCGSQEYEAFDAGLLGEGKYRVVFEVFNDSNCSGLSTTVMKEYEIFEGPA